MKSKKPSQSPEPKSSPFVRLGALRDALPAGPSPSETSQPAAPKQGPARAVVRLERKGRGGKEVTVVEGLELASDGLDDWLVSLKNALGCGGKREEKRLVLQGDQRERLPALLIECGVRKVIRG